MPAPSSPSTELADRIIQSEVVSKATANAVITADQLANGGPVTIDHCRVAAKRLRAKLRVVAAAFGFVRCAHCGEFIHVSFETDPENFGECAHLLDCEDDEMQAALLIHSYLTALPIRASISQHAAWTARMKRFGTDPP